jgi:hypothetical protein
MCVGDKLFVAQTDIWRLIPGLDDWCRNSHGPDAKTLEISNAAELQAIRSMQQNVSVRKLHSPLVMPSLCRTVWGSIVGLELCL